MYNNLLRTEWRLKTVRLSQHLGSTPCPGMEGNDHPFRRLKLMSSTSLSDLGKSEKAAALEDRATQHRRPGANATWNSIHNAVISVFQRKDLGENELYILNEGVRQLLKTELGSFFTEYLQNQLLTKGMVILRDKLRFYEGQKLLDSLAETWDFFFCDVLSMLQAIFYPVQGKEPSVRQLALLHFRNIITLNLKLEDSLSRPRARTPPSIIQMLLILQGVHESKGVSEDYLRLEGLLQKVVSPYLGTQGLFSPDGSNSHCSCVLEKRLQKRWPRPGDPPTKNPVVRSQSYNIPMLTPVVEYDPEASSTGSMGIRRHSVCEMTSCQEEQSSMSDTTSSSQVSTASLAQPGSPSLGQDPSLTGGILEGPQLQIQLQPRSHSPSIFPTHSPGGLLQAGELLVSLTSPPTLLQDTSLEASSSSSPETVVDQLLESMDSDPDGIFIDFPSTCSGSSSYSRESGQQSVV
ncbi:proline-rich protein 5-like isoform X3 [Osmerus eperlanus]|uniref:proline-rich protein 5-like isoform X3 n=1 Tax=Osmerus eperlanus TaxID=29151 RepID=UPI002E0D184D